MINIDSWPTWKNRFDNLILIPIVTSVVTILIGYIFKLNILISIIIFETILLLMGFAISWKKFRSICLFRRFNPQKGCRLVQAEKSTKVYLISSGVKRWIKEPVTLYELGFDIDMVEKATRKQIDSYPEKYPLSVYWFSEVGKN